MKRHFEKTQQSNSKQKIYRSFIVNQQKTHNFNKASHSKYTLDDRSLSPWITMEDKKQIMSQQLSGNNTNKFLQKILFRSKKTSIMPQIQTFKLQNHRQGLQVKQNTLQNIIVFPKSASSRKQISQRDHKDQQNCIFAKAKGWKFRQKSINQSKIVSIDLQLIDKEEIKINPQKILKKSPNFNPYILNQKKKQLLKFKMKHHNKLTNFYEQEREQELQKQLKYTTEHSKKTISSQFTPGRGLKTAKTIWNKRKKSLEINDFICQGEVIPLQNITHYNRFRKLGIISQDKTVFLY